MAGKTINQRVALEGAEDIQKTLKEIGADGEQAFSDVAEAAERAGQSITFGRALDDLRGQLANVGEAGRNLGGSLRDLGSAFANIGRNVAIAGAAVAGAVVGFVALAKSGTELADSQTKAAQAAGVPVDAFGRLAFAADQSGVSQEQLGTALNFLNRDLGEVAAGNDKAAEKFRKLGVQVKGANGQLRPTEEIFKDIADRLAELPDGAEKSAIAIDLFGRSGSTLIPLLNSTSRGINELGAQAENLGIVFTAEQARVAEAMNDALSALNQARIGVQAQLGLLFAPTITQAAEGLTDLITRNRVAIEGLAQRGLAVAVPLVEDFINALTGNDVAVRSRWILDARDSIIAFGQAVVNVISGVVVPAYQLLLGAANLVANAVNSIFGRDFTGQEVLVAAFVAKIIGLFGLVGPAIAVVKNFAILLKTAFLALPAVGAAVTATFGVIAASAKVAVAAILPFLGWPALLVAAVIAAGTAVVVFWDQIKAGAQATFDFIVDLFATIGEFIGAGFAAAGEIVGRVWDEIKAASGVLWGDIKSGFDRTWTAIENGAQRVASRIRTIWQSLRQVFNDFEEGQRNAQAARTARQQEFAAGGMVRGPGTATSDSILARLSNGEFVIRAAAVRHYGPQLLAALNSLRLPRQGFAMGGLVQGLTTGISGALPRFAEGGLVAVPAGGGGRPLTLQIDGQTISGLTASPAAVEQIERFTTNRVLRSTGRRPGWMG